MGMFRGSLCLLLLTLACSAASPATPYAAGETQPESQELVNLRAFARLYGVLRFFHPSDEAATIDWNRYAVLGVTRVRVPRDSLELEATLEALVLPIAPTVQIRGINEPGKAAVLPVGDSLISWQHLGPGFDNESTGSYHSLRTARVGEDTEDLFEERVAAGEVAEVDLGGGLSAHVPLAIWSREGHTLHLVGILPTIPVEPTVAGIRAGRDEILDRALEVIRAKLDD